MEFAFWFVAACIASYVAGYCRKGNFGRDDEAFLRLESKLLTTEFCLAQSTAEAAAWRDAFVQAEAVIDEGKARLQRLAWSHREQVVLNGELIARVHQIGASPN